MKPSVQKIVAKLAKEQEKEANVKLEKVELAKKPENIMKQLQSVNDRMRKAEAAMEKAFITYREKHQDYRNKLLDLNDRRGDLSNDLIDVKRAIQDLGIKPDQVKSYAEAEKLARTLENIHKNLMKLYPSVT